MRGLASFRMRDYRARFLNHNGDVFNAAILGPSMTTRPFHMREECSAPASARDLRFGMMIGSCIQRHSIIRMWKLNGMVGKIENWGR